MVVIHHCAVFVHLLPFHVLVVEFEQTSELKMQYMWFSVMATWCTACCYMPAHSFLGNTLLYVAMGSLDGCPHLNICCSCHRHSHWPEPSLQASLVALHFVDKP